MKETFPEKRKLKMSWAKYSWLHEYVKTYEPDYKSQIRKNKIKDILQDHILMGEYILFGVFTHFEKRNTGGPIYPYTPPDHSSYERKIRIRNILDNI